MAPAIDPIVTLGKLIPKPTSTFELHPVTIQDTYDVISDMSATNARGFDFINSRTLKMIPHITSLWMTHLFNCIVLTKAFPKIWKVIRILPILKPKKLKTTKTSYGPVANLSVFEKITEELMKRQLSEYFESNDLILKNHHGGRKGYSTVTPRAVVDAECSKVTEKK